VRCFLRFFKKSSFKVVRILVKTSRRFMSDDITSIRAENLYVFQTINILQNQVINTSKLWLLRVVKIVLIEFDKTRYFVTYLCDFIKRSMIYVLRVKSYTFEVFRHFQPHNEHENNRIRRFCTNWKKKYSSNEFDDYRFEHDIK
jgi:hypothetical protein